jgi:hypothetical protein
MNRSILAKAVVSASAALVFGFGLRGAVASPVAEAQSRPYCSDAAHCQRICETLYPGYDGFAICSSGHTCYC